MTNPAPKPDFKEIPLPRDFLRRQVFLFLLALGFLTCLTPAKTASTEALRRSCIWYPATGIALGLILYLPFFFFEPSSATAPLWAVGWVVFSARLTRALHYDGLADVLDALGSGKTDEGFRAVLKDSRIGTFGVLGLVLVVLGQVAAVSILILTPEWRGTLLVAPVFGRCAPIVLTFLAPPHPKAGLGSITCEAPRGACLLTAVAVATLLPFFCLPARYVPALLGVTVVLLGLALTFIARVARRENGLSGDFFGCAIIAGECSALLAACLLR